MSWGGEHCKATRPQGYPRLVNLMPFNCSRCGLCCMMLGLLRIKDPENKAVHRGDGVCVHLKPNLECGIYATRPRVCNVEKSAPKWLPLRVTYWITERICWTAQLFSARIMKTGGRHA